MTNGMVLMENRVTGTKFWAFPPKNGPEIRLKHAVEGLKAFECAGLIRFEMTSAEEINEPVAVDAQCRAGWNDAGYGFYELEVKVCKYTGIWTANWKCSMSCD